MTWWNDDKWNNDDEDSDSDSEHENSSCVEFCHVLPNGKLKQKCVKPWVADLLVDVHEESFLGSCEGAIADSDDDSDSDDEDDDEDYDEEEDLEDPDDDNDSDSDSHSDDFGVPTDPLDAGNTDSSHGVDGGEDAGNLTDSGNENSADGGDSVDSGEDIYDDSGDRVERGDDETGIVVIVDGGTEEFASLPVGCSCEAASVADVSITMGLALLFVFFLKKLRRK